MLNHAEQLHLNNFTNVMQQKQKRGHHFIFKADHKTHSNAKKQQKTAVNMRKLVYIFIVSCNDFWPSNTYKLLWFFRLENCLVSPSHLIKQISEKNCIL